MKWEERFKSTIPLLIVMEPLFQSRISIIIARHKFFNLFYGFGIWCGWPFSKLEIYRNYLILKIFRKQFKLNFDEIDYLEKRLFGVRIHHHSSAVKYEYIYLYGILTGSRLFKKLSKTISKNNLKLKIK